MKAETHRRTNSSTTQQAPRRFPIRILTAVPICDGHDSAIVTANLELVRHGIEVIYLGYHRSVRDIVRAAIQEDVQAIGLSSYNGGHVEFFTEVIAGLKRAGAHDIAVFGGGGGTITSADAKSMQRRGARKIFFAGTPLAEMAGWIKRTFRVPPNISRARMKPASRFADRELSKLLTAAERARHSARRTPHSALAPSGSPAPAAR